MSVLDWIIFAVFVFIFAASALTVVYPIFFGLGRTNLSDKYIWGLGIQGFFFLSTMACGILAVISISVIHWDGFSSFKEFELAATIAFACLISAQILMGADLGRPFRALKIITGRNFASPLTLDFISLAALTVLSFVYMFGILMNDLTFSRLWAYATLFFALLCLLVHVMLFILKTPSGFTTRSFDAIVTVSCGIWSGTAVIALLTMDTYDHELFFNAFLIITLFVFVSQIGVFISAFLTGQKPHNLLFMGLSFIVLVLLAGHDLIFRDTGKIVEAAICILAIVAVFIEKIEMILSYQRLPVLPAPYSMYDRDKPYRPSLLEAGNLIAGLSLIVVVTYAVIIFKVYILPFIISLFI